MKSRYNIALVPMVNSNQVITLSNKLSNIADEYLLGNNSLPHVTLCQFLTNENEVPDIWDHVCESLHEKTTGLIFKEFSCMTFNNIIFWVSLLPDTCDKLMEMNCIVAEIIKNPVSKSYKEYDPHMTLINTKNKDYKRFVEELSKLYIPITDKFILSLGKSDDIGQYTKMIFKYDNKPIITWKV